MLKERPQIQDQFFEVLRQKIFSGTSEAKIRALSVFAEIIRNDDDIISETSEVVENLFDKLNSTGKLLNLILQDMEKRKRYNKVLIIFGNFLLGQTVQIPYLLHTHFFRIIRHCATVFL